MVPRHRLTLLPAALIVLVVLFAAWVRLAHLGRAEFTNDELYHYYAGQSLEAGKGPLLPSGVAYDRGVDITRLSARAIRLAAPTEFAARLPSATFGTLDVILIAVVGWLLGGPWVGFWAAVLLAVQPEAVFQSRQVRFYTYQLVFGLVALYAGWRALHRVGRRDAGGSELRREWTWLAVAVATLLLALRVQITTFSVLAGFAAAVVAGGAIDLRADGRAAWRRSAPLQASALGVIFGFVAVALAPSTVARLLHSATQLPVWAQLSPGSPLFYYYALSEHYPVVVALLPVIALGVLIRDWRLGGYLILWFAVPVAVHSALPWKGERFVLLATPALFILVGIAAAGGSGALRRFVELRFMRRGRAALAGASAVTVAALVAILTLPAFNSARRAASDSTYERTSWRRIAALLRERPDAAGLPFGGTDGIQALHYIGKVDFSVQLGARDAARPASLLRSLPPGILSGDTLDFYVDAPVTTTPEAIRRRFAGHPAVLIAMDSMRVTFNNVSPALLTAVRREGEELCQGRCGSMRLYRWPLDSTAAASP